MLIDVLIALFLRLQDGVKDHLDIGRDLLADNLRYGDLVICQRHAEMCIDGQLVVMDRQRSLDDTDLFLAMDVKVPFCPDFINAVDIKVYMFNDLPREARFWKRLALHVVVVEVLPLKVAVKSMK